MPDRVGMNRDFTVRRGAAFEVPMSYKLIQRDGSADK